VTAYNSNGLWVDDVGDLGREAAELVAEGGFSAVKRRLGRDRLDELQALAGSETASGRAWS
jgi:mandelate racemase